MKELILRTIDYLQPRIWVQGTPSEGPDSCCLGYAFCEANRAYRDMDIYKDCSRAFGTFTSTSGFINFNDRYAKSKEHVIETLSAFMETLND